jgi:hypothetical protein
MQSTLKPKQTDDPHDFLVVAPDAVRVAPDPVRVTSDPVRTASDPVRVAPADEELSNLLQAAAARYRSDPQTGAGVGIPAGPKVPRVDATFRPAAVNNVGARGKGWPTARRLARGFVALLLAACIGAAAVAWRTWGDTAKKQFAKLTTQLVVFSSLPPEKSELPAQATAAVAQPAAVVAQVDAANAAPPPLAQPAAETITPAAAAAAAPSPDQAQSLQSMARDLASAGQEIALLKASVEQLRANQQQISRDVAKASEVKASEAKATEVKASEQNVRPRTTRISAPPPRAAAAPARKPLQPYPPRQTMAAPALPPAPPPYQPRQVEPEPQGAAEPLADPELASAPRPPLPVR